MRPERDFELFRKECGAADVIGVVVRRDDRSKLTPLGAEPPRPFDPRPLLASVRRGWLDQEHIPSTDCIGVGMRGGRQRWRQGRKHADIAGDVSRTEHLERVPAWRGPVKVESEMPSNSGKSDESQAPLALPGDAR